MDAGDEAPPRTRVLRVTVTVNGTSKVYWHPWIEVRLDIKRVEIYHRAEGGEPVATHCAREISIDWRAPEGNVP